MKLQKHAKLSHCDKCRKYSVSLVIGEKVGVPFAKGTLYIFSDLGRSQRSWFGALLHDWPNGLALFVRTGVVKLGLLTSTN